MIRPLTIATFLMACGSGLYLYQSKHEVQLLDRTIERAVGETSALREQSRLLAVEWTMLNDPERLRRFSDTYLNLKSIEPRQFTSLVDLDNRLPAPRQEVPSRDAEEREPSPVAAETGAQPDGGSDAVALPVPPIPGARPILAIATVGHPSADPKVADTKVADTRTPVSRPSIADNQGRSAAAADARANDQRAAEQHAASRLVENRPEVRQPPAPPRPVAIAAPRPIVPATSRSFPLIAQLYAQPGHVASFSSAPTPVLAPAPVPVFAPAHASMGPVAGQYSGSLLGMARSTMPAAPRPTPVNVLYDAN